MQVPKCQDSKPIELEQFRSNLVYWPRNENPSIQARPIVHPSFHDTLYLAQLMILLCAPNRQSSEHYVPSLALLSTRVHRSAVWNHTLVGV